MNIEELIIRERFNRLKSEAEGFAELWTTMQGACKWNENIGDTYIPDLLSAVRMIEDWLP